MINETEIRQMIEKIIKDINVAPKEESFEADLISNPHNLELLKDMTKLTPARIGLGRAGSRYTTQNFLRFRTDHAAAMDAVFTSVSEEFLTGLNLTTFQTKCIDKDHYLTRPDLGRQFDTDVLSQIKAHLGGQFQVVLYVSDGLSSTAVEANAPDALQVIQQGLKAKGITTAPAFFVKYGRVPAMDPIAEATGADVCCVLIGERPGLVTAESMSAYLAYRPTVNMPEARRNVMSNIHKKGTPAVEAGAYIVDLIEMMIGNKASGLDLKL